MKKADGHEPSAEHKTAICDEDLAKLHFYFEDVLGVPDSVKLRYFCLYHLTLHFALRGSEIQTQLKKQDIVIEIDPNGKEYVTLKRDFMSKNCAGGLDGNNIIQFAIICMFHLLIYSLVLPTAALRNRRGHVPVADRLAMARDSS